MVIICGLGFLGSWTNRFLAQRMFALHIVEKVVLIDDGKIEDRNLPTQYFYPGQIMGGKAKAAGSVLRQYNIEHEIIDQRLDQTKAMEIMMGGEPVSLVIDAFDNLEARTLAKMMGMTSDCLHISISPSRFGMVEWSRQWHLDPTKNLTPSEEVIVQVPPCELAVYQQLGIQVGARAAVEATQHLLGMDKKSWHVTEESTEKL